jgi:hypothetical protein
MLSSRLNLIQSISIINNIELKKKKKKTSYNIENIQI